MDRTTGGTAGCWAGPSSTRPSPTLIPYADGRWRVGLRRPGTGRAVTVWADAEAYPWLQVFTGDSLPEPLRRTSGVAVEPMTCPPDAFRSGQDLVVLAPGQEFEGDWGISPA